MAETAGFGGVGVMAGVDGKPVLAELADLCEGVTIQWWQRNWIPRRGWSELQLSGSPLIITRRGPSRPSFDWLAVRVHPEVWEREGHEWLIPESQVRAGRYAIIGRAEASLRTTPTQSGASGEGNESGIASAFTPGEVVLDRAGLKDSEPSA